jgi:hypothetical protein
VDDGYKPGYVKPAAGSTHGAGYTNHQSEGLRINPNEYPGSYGSGEHAFEKNPDLYKYKDSKVLQPYNIHATDAIRCMNCGEAVRRADMDGHIKARHSAAY